MGKIQEKQKEKAARQAGRVKPREQGEAVIWWRTKGGEMEGEEGSVIAGKQAEPATAGGRGGKKSSLERNRGFREEEREKTINN